jgi:DNA-binding transcriptional LysR family regulator
MDARRLLIFREVARSGSISAAARALGWTQPAVSQHLRTLEREAGSTLLLRSTAGVELTEPGRVLLARADEIAAQLHMAEQELAALTQLRRGRVRLAAYPSGAATLVPPAVARLRRRHPDIDITLTEAEPPEATALVTAGEADLALVFAYGDAPFVPDQGLHWRPIGDEPVHLVLPPDHRLADRPDITIDELAGESWIVGCARCRAHSLRLCARAGFEPVVEHTTDDYVVVQNLIVSGLGIALLPDSAVKAHRHPDVIVRENAAWGIRTYGVLHREGADRVPANAALIRAIEGAA